MTASGIWQDIGAGENLFTRILRLLFLVAAAAILCFLAILPLNWPQQAVLGLLSLVVALVMARSSDSYLVTLTLMMLSMFCTFRYGYWRVAQVIQVSSGPRQSLGSSRRLFHPLPASRRGLRLRHSLSRLLPDHLAAAPRPGVAA